MLFQAIQAKSWELEKALFNKHLDQALAIEFLDTLIRAIPYVADAGNYGRTLTFYRKWKAILRDDFNYFYDKSSSLDLSCEESSVDEQVHNQLERFLEFSELKENAKASELILSFSSQLDPSGSVRESAYFGDDKEEVFSLIKAISIDAECAYRESNFDDVIRVYENFLDYAVNKIDQGSYDTLDCYFLSWVLHGLGNVEYACQRYKSAHEFFKYSYHLKTHLWATGISDKNVLRLGMYATQSKLIATSLAFPTVSEVNYQQELMDLKREWDKDRDELIKVNRSWFLGIDSYIDYLIGRSYLYFSMCSTREKASEYLERSANTAKVNGNYAAQLRVNAFRYTYQAGFDDFVHEASEVFDLNEDLKNQPIVRRLVTGTLPLEMEFQSSERAAEVEQFLVSNGVSPLDNAGCDCRTAVAELD